MVLTGYGAIATAVAAVKIGATDYLSKPADANDITAALLAEEEEIAAAARKNPMSADRVRWEHIQRVYELCDRNVSETARRTEHAPPDASAQSSPSAAPVAIRYRCATLPPSSFPLSCCSACVTTPEEPELPPFTLTGTGIDPTISRLSIDFGRAQVGVIDTVSRLLREGPVEITTVEECGAGPMTIARWDGGLSLNFIDEDFRGWVSSDPTLPVDGGFTPR